MAPPWARSRRCSPLRGGNSEGKRLKSYGRNVKVGRRSSDKAAPYLPRWRRLRPRHLRPHRRAAEQRDERAPSYHSITSSAKVRSLGGISIPSTFEVLRLITNSNLVGCITGRLAGFAPFRIFPT